MGALEATLADGTTLIDERAIRIGLAPPRYRGKTDVVYYDGGLSATSYAFFLQDIGCTMFVWVPRVVDGPVSHLLYGVASVLLHLRRRVRSRDRYARKDDVLFRRVQGDFVPDPPDRE